MSKKSLREEMPNTAAFIDRLRAAFGAELINEQIKKGINGEPTFYARENGHEIGTSIPRSKCRIRWGANGVAYIEEGDND